MPFSTSPVIGTIAIQPRSATSGPCLTPEADDSSLAALLASLVRGPLPVVHEDDAPASLFAYGRFSRFGFSASPEGDFAQADLLRLEDDLNAEYQRLALA